jgi:hypothetical protein
MMQEWRIDATKFQEQLAGLATTIAYKVQRERVPTISPMASADIYVLIRQAQRSYDLFFYLNAEEHRAEPGWRAYYTTAALPAIRSMIDCLYNITVMLEDPQIKPLEFRKSGYRIALEGLEEDQRKYGNNPDPVWAEWLQKYRQSLLLALRGDGFSLNDVMTSKKWPLLGTYLRENKNVPFSDHQNFLKTLTFGFWREYSDYSHGTFQGLIKLGVLYVPDVPHEYRDKVDEKSLSIIFGHMARAAAILLCILTELQAFFRFDGARINERLHEVWNALLGAPEIKELYDQRYAELMMDRRIEP